MNKFLKAAVKEAEKGVKINDGGPFGAVIVKNNKIIARGHSEVLKNNDPTAHAEMVTIRKASKKLKRFNLSDRIIYSSCEPCPMCFGAIHWAKIKTLYYGCTRKDAEDIGFDDKFIYDVLQGKKKDNLKSFEIDRKDCLEPFKKWKSSKKKLY